MNFIFKNIIAIISIIPIGLIFYLNNIAIYEINFFIIGIMLFLPILLTSISIYGMKYFDQEIISNINEISCIDYKILLMYIGYMILAFNNIYVVSFIFGLIFFISVANHSTSSNILIGPEKPITSNLPKDLMASKVCCRLV